MKCRILYEDRELLVVYKPAGLATETARIGQRDLVSELKNDLASEKRREEGRAGAGKESGIYLGMIHRLDQPVEGLLVFAREKAAAAELSRQLESGILQKQYLAVLCGRPDREQGELVDELLKEDGRARVVTGEAAQYPKAKRCVLQYRIRDVKRLSVSARAGEAGEAMGLADYEMEQELALAEIHLDTGRFHQIRAQMAHAGYPLLGDIKYGTEESARFGRELGVEHVALCAHKLEFQHPVSGEVLSFRVEPEGDIFQLFQIQNKLKNGGY